MKKKNNKLKFILFIFAYILIAPVKEAPLYEFVPAWSINTNSTLIKKTASDDLIQFKTSGILGSFSFDGELNLLESIFHGAAQSSSHYINYSRVNENLVIKKSNGDFALSLTVNGYPVFVNDRLFIISHDRKKISEWNMEGEFLASYEKESEITSLDANSNDFTAGFTDGTAIISDKDRNVKELIKPVSSRLNAVYGTAISHDSEMTAIISGIDPQNVIIMKKNSSRYNSFLTSKLPENLRYSRLIKFTEDNRYLYFEGMNYFYCYDLNRKKLYSIVLDSKVVNILYLDNKELFFVITRDMGFNTMYLLFPDGRILYRKNFTGEDVFLKTGGERVFIGSDNFIYSLDITLD